MPKTGRRTNRPLLVLRRPKDCIPQKRSILSHTREVVQREQAEELEDVIKRSLKSLNDLHNSVINFIRKL